MTTNSTPVGRWRTGARGAELLWDGFGKTVAECDTPTVPYEWDAEAKRQAAMYAIDSGKLGHVAELLTERTWSVRAHRVGYSGDAWPDAAYILGQRSGAQTESKSVSRGEVIDLAKLVLDGSAPPQRLLAATYMWGWGKKGFGRARYDKVVKNSDGDPNPRLHVALSALRCEGSVKAYELLLGGTQARTRARLGAPGYARISGFGPAFFTKFLYFASAALAESRGTQPEALILDSRLARRVNDLSRLPDRPSGMPYLVRPNGKINLWSCYRYAIYIHWMEQTASELGVPADVLEYALFDTTEGIPNDETADV